MGVENPKSGLLKSEGRLSAERRWEGFTLLSMRTHLRGLRGSPEGRAREGVTKSKILPINFESRFSPYLIKAKGKIVNCEL